MRHKHKQCPRRRGQGGKWGGRKGGREEGQRVSCTYLLYRFVSSSSLSICRCCSWLGLLVLRVCSPSLQSEGSGERGGVAGVRGERSWLMERRSLSLVSPAPSTPVLMLSKLMSSQWRAASLWATAALSMAIGNTIAPAAATVCFDVCLASCMSLSVLMCRGWWRVERVGE